MAQPKQLSVPDIVERVKERIKCGSTDPIGRATHAPAPPATQAGIAVDEQTLGYPFPPLLKRLYVEVGNGGWGPGYGLLGLTGGARDDLGKTAIQDYLPRRGQTKTTGLAMVEGIASNLSLGLRHLFLHRLDAARFSGHRV